MIETLTNSGMSQGAIARAAKSTQANISRIKNGQEPKAGLAKAIEQIYQDLQDQPDSAA